MPVLFQDSHYFHENFFPCRDITVISHRFLPWCASCWFKKSQEKLTMLRNSIFAPCGRGWEKTVTNVKKELCTRHCVVGNNKRLLIKNVFSACSCFYLGWNWCYLHAMTFVRLNYSWKCLFVSVLYTFYGRFCRSQFCSNDVLSWFVLPVASEKKPLQFQKSLWWKFGVDFLFYAQ